MGCGAISNAIAFALLSYATAWFIALLVWAATETDKEE